MTKETIKKTLGRGDKAPSVSAEIDLDAILDDVGAKIERSLAKGHMFLFTF